MTETQAQDGQADQTSESSTDTTTTQDNTQQTTQKTTQEGGSLPEFASGVKPEYADVIKAKGWQNVDDVLSSYSNLEKYAGKFGSRGVVIPDSDSPEEWGKVYDKLGRPEAPNGYEFNHIDISKAEPSVKENLGEIAKLGHKHGFSKKQLEGFVKDFDEVFSAKEQAEVQELQKKVDSSIQELKGDWGAAWDQNLALAKQAAKKFGVEGEKLDALENYVGFAPMMRVLAEMGANMSEDGFVSGQSGGGDAVMTPKQAKQALQEVQSDPDYLDPKKNPNRHKMLREKARNLYAQVYPGQQE